MASRPIGSPGGVEKLAASRPAAEVRQHGQNLAGAVKVGARGVTTTRVQRVSAHVISGGALTSRLAAEAGGSDQLKHVLILSLTH